MKILPKHYARALYDLVEGAEKNEVAGIVTGFLDALKKNNHFAKADHVVVDFVNIWNKEKGIINAEIVSANKLDEETIALLNEYIAKLSGTVFVEVKESLDKNLLGGVVLKFGDKVMDGSLKARLRDLRAEIAK